MLIGREDEIHRLFDSMTLIEAEDGIGKSTLVQEFYDQLGRDPTKYFAGIYKIGEFQSLTYPFISVLEHLLKRLAHPELSKRKGIWTIISENIRGSIFPPKISEDIVSNNTKIVLFGLFALVGYLDFSIMGKKQY